MEQLGKYLKRLRKEKNLTLIDVQKKTRISTGYLSEIERGNRASPHPTILKKLAGIYGVSDKEIMEVAGYLAREGKKIFTQQEEIAWAFSAALMDPEFGRFINRGRARFMPSEMKVELIRYYEKMTGKKLLP